jgi:hypothetical protein
MLVDASFHSKSDAALEMKGLGSWREGAVLATAAVMMRYNRATARCFCAARGDDD